MGRLTSKPISFKQTSVERISSYGQILSCPVCEGALMLKDTRDGDQAYWCHRCNRGWRAGHLPPEARRAKAKALLETALEIEPEVQPIPEVVILEPEVSVKTKAPRVKKLAETIILEPEVVVKKSRAKSVSTLPKTAPSKSKPFALAPEISVKTKAPRVAKTTATPEVTILGPEVVVKPKRASKKLALEVTVSPEPKVFSISESKAPTKTKTPRVTKAALVVLETPPVIVPAPRKRRTPKVVLPEVVAQPIMLEPIKQKARASTRVVKQHSNIIVQQDLFA